MKWIVTRTSGDSKFCPVEGASRRPITTVDYRTCSEVRFDELQGTGPKWRDQGKNHRLVQHGIARDVKGEAWVIQINSLKQLLAFVREHGPCVISPPENGGGLPSIEIYDDYRE